MKKLKILHVFSDNIFGNTAFDYFDSFENLDNLFYFYTPSFNYKFIHLKDRSNLKIINNKKEYLKLFSDKKIDAIYFHSLPMNEYSYFNYIDKTKIVFLWSWGYDIYRSPDFSDPLISIDLYKQKTLEERKKCDFKNGLIFILKRQYRLIKSIYYNFCVKKVFNRIDYYTPVLAIENELIRKNVFFRAKPFGISAISSPGRVVSGFSKNAQIGNIIIGNSLTYENNHLDIFDVIKNMDIQNRKIIVPISYGEDYLSKEHFIEISRIQNKQIIWLKDFLDIEEYKQIYKSISFAIFGHLRQQAVGNLLECFLNGVKIFLYKNSINYQNFKRYGFIIYSIEDDLDENELKIPLTDYQALTNYNLIKQYEEEKINKTQQQINELISSK